MRFDPEVTRQVVHLQAARVVDWIIFLPRRATLLSELDYVQMCEGETF